MSERIVVGSGLPDSEPNRQTTDHDGAGHDVSPLHRRTRLLLEP